MLCLYSSATHCIEWHAPPQNSLVPVASTITCVPITPAAPIKRPTTSSASTDHVALGEVSRRHHPRLGPSLLSRFRSSATFSSSWRDARWIAIDLVFACERTILTEGLTERLPYVIRCNGAASAPQAVAFAQHDSPHISETTLI